MTTHDVNPPAAAGPKHAAEAEPTGGCPVTGAGADPGAGRCPVAHGPKGLPVIGVAPAYFRDPADYTLKMQQQLGSLVQVSLPKPFVQITEPSAIEKVLRGNPDNYTRGELYKGFAPFMGKGLLTLNDPEWRPHRKVVQPAFTPKRVVSDAEEAVPATEAVIRLWEDAARRDEQIDIAPDVMTISTRTMGKALIGRDLSEDGLGYGKAAAIASKVMYTRTIMGLNELLPSFLPTGYNREKKWAHKVLDGIVADVIRERRESGELGDDAAGLLLASDLDDQAVADNLRTLFLAGTDTTGQALAWTLYELSMHPRARQEVEEEVDRVLDGRTPDAELREQLPVTRSAIEEALRLHPPVWQFPRDSIEDEDLAGRHVPGGTTLLLSTYGTHRSPEHWDDPEAFEPSRFRDRSTGDRERLAYFPFGGGRRQCIGKSLAMATLVTAVAMLTQRFRLTLVGALPVKPGYYITLFPADGVHMTVKERRS